MCGVGGGGDVDRGETRDERGWPGDLMNEAIQLLQNIVSAVLKE